VASLHPETKRFCTDRNARLRKGSARQMILRNLIPRSSHSHTPCRWLFGCSVLLVADDGLARRRGRASSYGKRSSRTDRSGYKQQQEGCLGAEAISCYHSLRLPAEVLTAESEQGSRPSSPTKFLLWTTQDIGSGISKLESSPLSLASCQALLFRISPCLAPSWEWQGSRQPSPTKCTPSTTEELGIGFSSL
jgi:hypothetical protein